MKNLEAGTRESAETGTLMVTLYVDACLAANQVWLECARLMQALVWQAGPLAAATALTDSPVGQSPRGADAQNLQRGVAAAAPPAAAAPDTQEQDRTASRQVAVAVAAPRKTTPKKAARTKVATPAVGRRAGVAKRRVRAAR